jgi:hypothetical protein
MIGTAQGCVPWLRVLHLLYRKLCVSSEQGCLRLGLKSDTEAGA